MQERIQQQPANFYKCRWVKAHREETDAHDQDDRQDIIGNNGADEQAGLASLHNRPTHDHEVTLYYKRWISTIYMQAMATTIAILRHQKLQASQLEEQGNTGQEASEELDAAAQEDPHLASELTWNDIPKMTPVRI